MGCQNSRTSASSRDYQKNKNKSKNKNKTARKQTNKEKAKRMNSTEVQNPQRKLDVFGSVACAKSAHVFQKLSYLLCRLCLSLSSLITLPQGFSTFHCVLRPPNSNTPLQVNAKAWPQSQTDLFTCTTVLHHVLQLAWSHIYCYVRYAETLHVKKMADLVPSR